VTLSLKGANSPTRGRKLRSSGTKATARVSNGPNSLVELKKADPIPLDRREQIVAFANRHKLPLVGFVRQFAAVGGLLSYGPSISWMYRQAGDYVGQILKGARPADMPVMQPTKFELVINLKTAKALGLTVPLIMQMTADEVLE
jgi:putative tryptophan/tyrosine transport system substrate-binding protein